MGEHQLWGGNVPIGVDSDIVPTKSRDVCRFYDLKNHINNNSTRVREETLKTLKPLKLNSNKPTEITLKMKRQIIHLNIQFVRII